ncbi:MAG: alpha/beta hydrolase [Cyanobacteria bacterium J06636_28]
MSKESLLNFIRFGYWQFPFLKKRGTGWEQSAHRLLQTAVLGLISGLATALPAQSAENIYFDYGFFGRVLPVSSLEKFAADGTVDTDLAPYISGLSPTTQERFRTLLSTPITELGPEVPKEISDPFAFSQWLRTPIGDIALTSMGLLIETEARQNGQLALRSAMILATADPAGLSLINFIRFYPTGGIRLNLPQILALADAIDTNIETTEYLVDAAMQLSAAAAAAEPDLDYSALPVLAETPQFEITQRSLTLRDSQRDRAYPVDLYFPEDLNAVPGPIPVMVFSHGYGDTRINPESVIAAQTLAAQGFLVAIPEHIGSNAAFQDDLAIGLTHESFEVMEFINRPLDIRFLLDTLEQQNATEFQGRLQLEQVGIVGESFGGYTALMTAGATIDVARLERQCDLEAEFEPDTVNVALLIQCRVLELVELPEAMQQLTNGSLVDDRISLVIALAPLTNLFGENGMNPIQIPVVIAGGDYDVATPIVLEQLTAFQWLTTPQKYFYLAQNRSHTSALTRIILDQIYPKENLTESFYETEEWFFSLTNSLIIAHGKVHLLDDKSYYPYLTSSYVEVNSSEPKRIHLLRSFPDDFYLLAD